ncbi:MAG: type II toxin-antitoxin system HicB family antitoxin [Caldilineaceae bacterium]|jgi:antitoxin HicB|nr:type II toxin-antitoxin system HicB family antitoxin [Caldilineaceae bacterium]
MIMNDVGYYLSLPYTIELVRENEGAWFARVAELPGCMTEGDSAEDAATLVQDALAGWIELALEDGRVIPEPKRQDEFSGKFVVRVSKSLHRDLVDAAAKEQVSLNQFIATELARAVGRLSGLAAPGKAALPTSTRPQSPKLATMHEAVSSYQAVTGSTESSNER